MLTLIVATLILALTYGIFWHNRPASDRDREGGDDDHKDELWASLAPKRARNRASECFLPTAHSADGESHSMQVNGATENATVPSGQGKNPSQPENYFER